MNTSVSCPSCGESLHDGEQACSRCGATVLACVTCGALLKTTDQFCARCGTSRTGTAPFAATLLEEAISPWQEVMARLRDVTAGEFQILRELGRGGMAAVYLAHDIALNRKVAIKVMSPGLLAGTGMMERFKLEAITVANLNHPHLVTMHSVRQAGGLQYFVMKLIPGASVERLIGEVRPLSIATVQAILFQVGSALHYAHRRGVIHRDVKPSNILMDEEGNAVVTDFGIAKVVESPSHTLTGSTVGTPAYMSPEQCWSREVTAASDQYSLGIVAYEMLSGRPPFTGPTLSILRAHTEDPPPPLAHARPDCPGPVAKAVHRMLAKEPAERWPSVMQAVEALGGHPIGEGDPLRAELVRLSRIGPEHPIDEIKTPHSPIPIRSPAPVAPRAPSPIPASPPAPEVGPRVRLREPPGPEPGAVAAPPAPPPPVPPTQPGVAEPVARVLARWWWLGPAAVALGLLVWLAWPGSSPRVVSVTVTPATASVVVGDSVLLAVRAADSVGKVLPGRRVTWLSADGPHADVSPGGMVRGRAPGRVLIRASVDGRLGTALVTVVPKEVPVTRVELSDPPARVEVGDRFTLAATARDAGGGAIPGRGVVWSSSRAAVATVSQAGEVSAAGPGRATITAAVGDQAGSVTVTVVELRVVQVRVAPPVVTVTVGDTARLRALATNERGETGGGVVIWESSNPAIAAVTARGGAVGVAPGAARIVATSGGVSGSASVTVVPARRQPPGGQGRPAGIAVVRLLVSPWANLSIDGVRRGLRTRGEDTVTAGVRHRLRFEREGFVTVDTSVTLRPGEQRLLRIQMIRRAS